MAQVRPDGCCWGNRKGGRGWDGIQRTYIGYCDKKPRPGRLTCWWHQSQETDAQRMKKKQDALAEAELCRTTCFHCGAPALPETHGLDPRCERHSDV